LDTLKILSVNIEINWLLESKNSATDLIKKSQKYEGKNIEIIK